MSFGAASFLTTMVCHITATLQFEGSEGLAKYPMADQCTRILSVEGGNWKEEDNSQQSSEEPLFCIDS